MALNLDIARIPVRPGLILLAAFSMVGLCQTASTACAVWQEHETILLKNGGKIQGKAEQVVENKQRFWIVTLADGNKMKLSHDQVKRVQRPSAEEREYLKLKDEMKDTVAGHWAMQKWCSDKRLAKQREYHLLRIIEIEPDHKDARAKLGYKDFNGEWYIPEHFYTSQGFVRDGGRFRLPIAVEMRDREAAVEKDLNQWNVNIRKWMTAAVKRNDQKSINLINNVTDSRAVPGLLDAFKKYNNIPVRKFIVDALGRINALNAQNALVQIATTVPDNQLDVAERAITLLKQPDFNNYNTELAAKAVIHWLNPSDGSDLTRRWRVNRAAWFIGRLEYRPAIRTLIEGLVTTHKVPTGAPQGNTNTSFTEGPNGSSQGLQAGNQPQFVNRTFQNQAALDTLRILVPKGINYDFNEEAWLQWYIRDNALGVQSVGRDQ